MPEKSVRQMSRFEREHNSLSARTFRAIISSSILIGLVALLIGLGLFVYVLTTRYIDTAFNASKIAESITEKVLDVKPTVDEIMEIYNSLDPERFADIEAAAYKREERGTKEFGLMFKDYFQAFYDIEFEKDFLQIRSILEDFRKSSGVDDIYLAMYDAEKNRLIHLVDPDDSDETGSLTGEFDIVSEKQVSKFLGWNGEGKLYEIANSKRFGLMVTAGVPVKDDNGETVAFFLADIRLNNVVNGAKMFFLLYAVSMFVIVNIVALVTALRMKKKLVDPLNSIAEAASGYVKDRKSGIDTTDHFSKLNIRTGDELENLALIMADMEKDLTEYEENLTKVTAEKERIGTELELATRIQADMLPNIYPAFPERPEFDIYATMTPAKEVGGDFYDFFLIDDDHLGLVMADVSGKGIPAALFMMASKILIGNYAMSGKSPGEVLAAVNDQICSNNREEMFVTVWLGVLDLRTGLIKAANAGHEYPVLKKPGGRFELIKDKHGFVIGGMSGMKYREYEIQMESGSKLFLYTDGVAEATDASGELFGTERMTEALNCAADGTTYDVLGAVTDAIGEFVQEAPQFDDITMLCLDFIGEKGKDLGKKAIVREITMIAEQASVKRILDFIDSELVEAGCPHKAQTQIGVAADELLSNIVQYAYTPEVGSVTVRLHIEKDPDVAEISFIDSGHPYNPLEHEDPDVTLSADEREPGGLGIFLVKKTMDDVSYEYRDNKNILKIRKQLA